MQYGVVLFETSCAKNLQNLFSPCICHRDSIERNENYALIVALLLGSVEEETSSHGIRTIPNLFLYGHDKASEVLSVRQCRVIVFTAYRRY
jgi:hypothetical protein